MKQYSAEFGAAGGDELPPWVASAEARRAKIREAMAALDAEAKAADGHHEGDEDDDPDDDATPPATGSGSVNDALLPCVVTIMALRPPPTTSAGSSPQGPGPDAPAGQPAEDG